MSNHTCPKCNDNNTFENFYAPQKSYIHCRNCEEDIEFLRKQIHAQVEEVKTKKEMVADISVGGRCKSQEYITRLKDCEKLLQDKCSGDEWATHYSDDCLKDAIDKVSLAVCLGKKDFLRGCVDENLEQGLFEELAALELVEQDLLNEAIVRGSILKKQKDGA